MWKLEWSHVDEHLLFLLRWSKKKNLQSSPVPPCPWIPVWSWLADPGWGGALEASRPRPLTLWVLHWSGQDVKLQWVWTHCLWSGTTRETWGGRRHMRRRMMMMMKMKVRRRRREVTSVLCQVRSHWVTNKWKSWVKYLKINYNSGRNTNVQNVSKQKWK